VYFFFFGNARVGYAETLLLKKRWKIVCGVIVCFQLSLNSSVGYVALCEQVKQFKALIYVTIKWTTNTVYAEA
jgi:hypothetical protein